MGTLGTVTRRTFLLGSAAIAGGVAFGYWKYNTDPHNPLLDAGPDPTHPDEMTGIEGITLNPWLLITAEGITVITPRAEMGQGIHTTLAALVAEELDVPWERVRAVHGPASATYFNAKAGGLGLPFAEYTDTRTSELVKGAMDIVGKFVGVQLTGGSTSTRDAFERMRRAGAAARATLLAAAAERLDVDVATLATGEGDVVAPDGTRLPYHALAADAARLDPPQDPPLKAPSDWQLLGRSLPRLDLAAKVDGRARYGIDVRLDDMLYATVRSNPRLGGTMRSFDASAARRMPGVIEVVDLGDGVGVVATSTWRAFRAIDAVRFDWDAAPYPSDTSGIMAAIDIAFGGEADSALVDDGDVAAALARAGRGGAMLVDAEYRVPYLAHMTMEPMNATARLAEGRLDIWSGNQLPTLIRDQGAKLVGLDAADVHVHTPYLGGGFGRRAEYDCTNQAVRLAMAMPGRAVKLTWSREEDTRHDFYRPAAIARLVGAVDASGIVAFAADVASTSVYRAQAKRAAGFVPPGPDKLLVEGMFDQPYAIPNRRVRGFVADVAVPVGSWRSVGNSYNAFFNECFLDELAQAADRDPIALRLALTRETHAPSHAVIEAVAALAEAHGAVPEAHARGVAFTHSFGSPTAQIVEVTQSAEGIRITRVWCAIDVGTALDPRNIEAQVSSGILFGFSAAIHGGIEFADGAVVPGNFDAQPILRIDQTPLIETRILESGREGGGTHIGGVGEPATPPSIPALVNAVSRLSGTRQRTLPLGRSLSFA